MDKMPTYFLIFILDISLVGIFVVNGAGHDQKEHEENGFAFENMKFGPLTQGSKLDIAAVEATFTNKGEYNYIEVTKRFTLSSETEIQYFEVMLQAKYNALPIEISLAGEGHQLTYCPPNLTVGDHVGCGIVHYDRKFYLFYTHEKEIKIGVVLDKSNKKYENGLRPLVAIKGNGTQISVRKECAYLPSMDELKQKIVQFVPIKIEHFGSTSLLGHGHQDGEKDH